MFETELAVKHTPQDSTRIHISSNLFTVQVMPHLLVFLTHAHSVTCDDGRSSTSDADPLYASLIPSTLLYCRQILKEKMSLWQEMILKCFKQRQAGHYKRNQNN